MIEVDNLSFRYRGRKRPALSDVSLSLADGGSLLVLGPSGGGKSTLALCLNGAIPQFVQGELHGEVRVSGRSTAATNMADLARQVGIVFQDPEAQFCMLTVDEEIAFGLENLAVPRVEMDARIEQALDWVGLTEQRQAAIETLSGGQKQRLALACVLAQQPRTLVLDEPTAQLDPAGAAELIDVLQRLKARGAHALVVIEHRLDEVMPLVDRVLVLDRNGEVIAAGPPREVLRDWADWLREAGVWVPQVTELALSLGQAVDVDRLPLSVDEAVVTMQPMRQLLDVPPADPATAGARDTVLEVRQLTFRYAGAAQPAVLDITTNIRAGEVTAIVGANGAGKSTLARLLCGIIQPPRGTVLLDGRDLRDMRLPAIARRVGYVFQYPEHQFVGRSVIDDVAFGLRRAGLAEPRARETAMAMLEQFGLAKLAEAHPYTLSHGEQRRLSVASMLVLGQDVLLLDEPTFGQDRRNADLLLDQLTTLAAAGRVIVAITHDMRLVAERADRVLAMAAGRLIFDGSPGALFARPDVLARAGLRPPPLVELGQRLGAARPALRIGDVQSVALAARS